MAYYGSALTPELLKKTKALESSRLATTGMALQPQDWQAIAEAGLSADVQRESAARDYALRERALNLTENQQAIQNQLTRDALEKEEKAATISGIGTLVTAGKTAYDLLTGGGKELAGAGTGAGLLGKIFGGGPTPSALQGSMTVAAPLAGAPAITTGLAPEVASEVAAMSAAYGTGATVAAPAAGFGADVGLSGVGLTQAELAAATPASVQSTISSVFSTAAPYAMYIAGAAIASSVISSAVTSHERGIKRQEESWYTMYSDPSTKTVQAKIDELSAIDSRLGDLAKDYFNQAGMDPNGILIWGRNTPASGYDFLRNVGKPIYDMENVPNWYGLFIEAPEAFRMGYDPFTAEGQEAYRQEKQSVKQEYYTGY